MGQKIHPKGFRLGITKYWDSIWFARTKPEYRKNVIEDFKIRKFIYNYFSRPKDRNSASKGDESWSTRCEDRGKG